MEEQLLAELYRAYRDDLLLYLLSLLRDREAAEDVLQETFLTAMLSLPKDHPNLRAWLFLVARNRAFAELRKERSKVSLEELAEPEDPGPGPPEGLLADERKRLLYRAIQRLGPRKRETVMLTYFGGLGAGEIARLFGTTAEAVRLTNCRARKEIKKFLEEAGYDLP